MNRFLLAFSFLSIVPVGQRQYKDSDFASVWAWFPIVGLFLGGLLTLMANLTYVAGLSQFSSAFLVLLLLTLFSGGLHLDGLADSADGLLGGKTKEAALRIMKDSSIGTFGVTAIVLLMIGKFVAIVDILSSGNWLLLIVAPVVARFSMVILASEATYPRQDGTAKLFIGNVSSFARFFAFLTSLATAAILSGIRGLLALCFCIVLSVVLKKFATYRAGGVTGDTLGACNELCELSTLIILSTISGTAPILYFF